MALTKVSGGILDPGINVVGVVTATGFDGPFVGGTGDSINAGIITATGLDVNGNGDISGNLVVGGNLTANGDFTTLNTTLREVELLRVESNSSAVAGIITQSGSGDILKLYDSSTPVFVVKDGGNVGIGTDNPTYPLEIWNSDPRIQLIDTDLASNRSVQLRNNQGSFVPSSSQHTIFYTGGSERVRIKSTGEVGIGTDNPQEELHILDANPSIRLHHNTGTNVFSQIVQNGANLKIRLRNDSSFGGMHIQGQDGTDTTTFVRVEGQTGRVGIGSDNPTTILDVVGDVKITGSDESAYGLFIDPSSSGGTYETLIGKANGDLRLQAGAATYQADRANILLKNSVKHIIINAETTNSKVGIGTDNPAKDFHVVGTSRFEQLDVVGFTTFATGTKFFHHTPRIEMQGNATATLSFVNATTGTTTNDGMLMGFSSSSAAGFINVLEGNHGFVLKTGGSGTGNERINISGVGTVSLRYGTTEEMVTARPNGAVELYHNGTKRLETTGTGVGISSNLNVTGIVTATQGVRVNADSSGGSDNVISVGESNDLSMYHQTGVSYLRNTNSGGFTIKSNTFRVKGVNGGLTSLETLANGAVDLYFNNTHRFSTTGFGATVFGEIAATQDYPTQKPTLNFNFTASKKLDSRFTYQRTGPASFLNEKGKIELVGPDAPRIDHDPTTRECKGLLIEESRTNQWLYSEDLFTYVTGGALQQATLANTTATTDPRGGTNAVLMAAAATGGAHSAYKNFTSGSNGDVHTASVWVKAAGVDYARIYVDTVGGNMGGPGVTFSTKNTWNVSATGVATQTRTSVDEYPNGWWRLSVSGSFSNRNDYYVHLDIEGGEGDIGYTGNGSDGIYLWGVQFETGAFPTSYIPTNGSTATRGTENVKIDGDDFTDFYNPIESTVICEFDSSNWLTYNNNRYERIWVINNGSESENFEMFKSHTDNNLIRYRVRDGNSNVLGAANITYGTNTTPKMAFALKLNDAAVAVDGTITGTTDTGIPMPTVDRLVLGNGVGNNTALNGHIRKFIYYPVKLPDSQVITLTS